MGKRSSGSRARSFITQALHAAGRPGAFSPRDRARSGGNGWRLPGCSRRDGDTRPRRRNNRDSRASRGPSGRRPARRRSVPGASVWMLPKSAERPAGGSKRQEGKFEQLPAGGGLEKIIGVEIAMDPAGGVKRFHRVERLVDEKTPLRRDRAGRTGSTGRASGLRAVQKPGRRRIADRIPQARSRTQPSWKAGGWPGAALGAGLKGQSHGDFAPVRRHRARERRGLRRRNRGRQAAGNVRR